MILNPNQELGLDHDSTRLTPEKIQLPTSQDRFAMMPLYSPAVLALRKIQDAKLPTGLVTLGQWGSWLFVHFKRNEPWFCSDLCLAVLVFWLLPLLWLWYYTVLFLCMSVWVLDIHIRYTTIWIQSVLVVTVTMLNHVYDVCFHLLNMLFCFSWVVIAIMKWYVMIRRELMIIKGGHYVSI